MLVVHFGKFTARKLSQQPENYGLVQIKVI